MNSRHSHMNVFRRAASTESCTSESLRICRMQVSVPRVEDDCDLQSPSAASAFASASATMTAAITAACGCFGCRYNATTTATAHLTKGRRAQRFIANITPI